METNKPVLLVFTELLFKNLFWYLIFSVIYFDSDPLNWWIVKSMWGRIILIFIELGIITSTFKDEDNYEKNTDG